MAIAGKVAITPKGNWNADTTYEKLDLVFYENASYVAIQPSTGVVPTSATHWMLMVQSAGGADLDGIINGNIQVGNAKTLDGHEAEYFLPKSGGTIDGNLEVITDLEGTRTYRLANAKRDIKLTVYADGTFRMYDATNLKALILSNADGTTTFNGTASGNIKLTDKPTGTYTGNGSATERKISTGGIGTVAYVHSSKGIAIVTFSGTTLISSTGEVTYTPDVYFSNTGEIVTKTDNSVVNFSGASYKYQVA